MQNKRDFLDLRDFTRAELLRLVQRAIELKNGFPQIGAEKPLAGRVVGLMFEKPSTRTRVSFEVGVHQLGGHAIFLNWRDIQIGRGEPIEDTARVLSRYLDAIVIRTYGHDVLTQFAKWSTAPIINGLSDFLHPCQVLGDLMTLKEKGVDITSMRAAWIGDGNNVANSWITAAEILGFQLTLACPEGYDPGVEYDPTFVKVTRDPREAVKDADVINTDVWTSMGQEEEACARKEIFCGFQVSADLLKPASPTVYVMHCLPAHRGEEITDEVMESYHSLIWDQAENRLHIQKAILEELLKP